MSSTAQPQIEPTADADSVLYTLDAGVALITLNRPQRLNSFNDQMHLVLRAALVRAAQEARCVVLTGAGRGFCAGQDLNDRAVSPNNNATEGEQAPRVDLGHTLETFYIPLVKQLRSLPMPVLGAINGVAAGAGANVALACDLTYAAHSASFIQSFSQIGLIPDAGGTFVLPRLVGMQRAMGLALLADKLSAQQAAQMGLVYQALPDDELLPHVMQVARKLAAGPTLGYARIKQTLYASLHNTFEQQLMLERDTQRELGASDDYREGVAAFMAKRAPTFKGK